MSEARSDWQATTTMTRIQSEGDVGAVFLKLFTTSDRGNSFLGFGQAWDAGNAVESG